MAKRRLTRPFRFPPDHTTRIQGASGELNLGPHRETLYEPPVMLSAQRRFAVGRATVEVTLR
jgi:hypothetical protein